MNKDKKDKKNKIKKWEKVWIIAFNKTWPLRNVFSLTASSSFNLKMLFSNLCS